ncbi:DUF3617 domain-containing protein [Rhizorhapis sp. SPR117]|uniref:DUF3617 domain-containing protein n=1 Tax=Rhizorhapis sp. SPR117 TaxID=2912611 RepID=UPI001F422A9D|nr:DUF3617 domain-containing protein [Rhizorhapis sp. SPR117]
MKSVMLLTAALAITLISGCEKAEKAEQDTTTRDTGSGSPTSSSIHIKPGLWESSFQVDTLEMDGMPAGMPPGMMDQMKSGMNRTALRYCVTPEEAARPNADFLTGQKKSNCTYKHMEMGGGTITAEVVCEQPDGKGRMQSKMKGRYATDSYDMAMDMQSSGMSNGGGMHMKARTSGKWVASECPADLKN